MKTKRTFALFMVLVLLLAFSGAAYALPAYLAAFNAKYGTSGTVLDTCGLCHISPAGGGPLNPYGTAFANAGHSFDAIENQDSDGDGFTNIVEINARTFPGDPSSHPAVAAAPVPTAPEAFPAFAGINLPIPSVTPSLSEPIGVGSIAVGGGNVEIGINTGTFAGQVDVYFALGAPVITSDIFLLTPAGFQPVSAGVAPWKAGVTGVNEDAVPSFSVSALPPGTYNFYLLVTPAGSLSAFYFWQTSFTIGVPITTNLAASQEVPPTASTGTGTATMAVDFGTGTIVGSILFSGLTGPATLAHFHQAPAGSNGPIVIPLNPPSAASGVIPISVPPFTSNLLTALRGSQLYLNIHTSANPGGEIRGQVVFPPIPISTGMDGSQEVPPTASSGVATANLSVDINTGAVTGSITFNGLTGPAQAAHFHQAAAGSNGPVIIPLTVPSAAAGTITVSGVVLNAGQLAALASNQLYLNIHTAANPNGEIRGQIYYPKGVPTP